VNAPWPAAVAAALSCELMAKVAPEPSARVHGGCINESYRWESDQGALFVKIAPAGRLTMLEAEAEGLEELREAEAVRVPRVLAVGMAEHNAYLALEWLELTSSSRSQQESLGKGLARQHRHTARQFGWRRDNTIGSTPQINTPADDWIEFFRERRLRYQLNLAKENGYAARLESRGAELLDRMDDLFAGHEPVPSLLHGDLWGGNWAVVEQQPVIFDPAVYYGDREADIAMTRLFGGFGREFYRADEEEWPSDSGATVRNDLYNLYHVLNHLNLFGAGYLAQAESMLGRLLAEVCR
jgi:protein-ribulosamine 3-kinase